MSARLSAETLLMLAALALYLYDSAHLLASNEAILTRGLGGRWRAGFGLASWRLGGKEPWLPNPLAPHAPHFRLRWSFTAAGEGAVAARRALAVPGVLGRLAAPALVSLACIFVGLPLALFEPLGLAFLFGVLTLLYVNIVVGLALLHAGRGELGLGRRPFATLAFECLVCPPFSINLVRKACAHVDSDESFLDAAARLLAADALATAHAQCLRRVDEAIEAEEEVGDRGRALRLGRSRFASPNDDDDAARAPGEP